MTFLLPDGLEMNKTSKKKGFRLEVLTFLSERIEELALPLTDGRGSRLSLGRTIFLTRSYWIE